MPTLRNRFNDRLITNSQDLRGIDLSEFDDTTVDLTGCLRNYTDGTLPHWVIEGSPEASNYGILRWACTRCASVTDFRVHLGCTMCTECCHHMVCNECDRHQISPCTHCDACSSCCECVSCDLCDRLRHDEDDDGNTCCHCARHCTCDTAEIYITGALLAPKKSKFKPKRLCGVEWEVNELETTHLSRWAKSCGGGLYTDGSCGWEAVTPPMAGDHIRTTLFALGKAIDASGTPVNSDCGIHVHVDARDLNWSDMYRLLSVYAHVESVLYVLAGQQRSKSDYAKPFSESLKVALESLDRKASVTAAVLYDRNNRTNVSPAEIKRLFQRGIEKKDYGRYKGLNICPWLRGRGKEFRGNPASDTTVEFRMHENTKNPERVTQWAELLVRLVDWISKATDREAEKLPKSPLRALCVIAPESAPWIVSRVREWRRSTTTRRDGKTRRSQNRLLSLAA